MDFIVEESQKPKEYKLIEIDRNEESISFILERDHLSYGILTLNAPYCDDEDKRKRLIIE